MKLIEKQIPQDAEHITSLIAIPASINANETALKIVHRIDLIAKI
jgi:hypothetical protein